MKYRILKEEEYEKCKLMLPNPRRRFWIDSSADLGPKRCMFVNDEGILDKKGAYCSDTTFWIRPVIEYEEGEKREVVFSEGQQVILYGLEWTAISDNVLVCDRCVEESKFDDTGASFEDSYLNYAIHQYFMRRTSEDAYKTPAATSGKSNEIVVDENEFSYSFLANVLCIFLAAAAGVICALSFSPISVSVFAIVVVAMSVILGKYNVKKIKEGISRAKKNSRREMIIDRQNRETRDANIKSEYELALDGITDEKVTGRVKEINNLLDAIMKTGNRAAQSKVKFFYLPETTKTLELFKKLSENGIETQNTGECMDIIEENLDKTIRLLKIEYDKATADSLLDARLSSGMIGKMLNDAENQENTQIVLK
ncbi:MAG: hypothetical protein K6G24_10545 [Lachnospiraceae bacterium]|nr:hypothetical protein [Lachnospiraceae bacterium]